MSRKSILEMANILAQQYLAVTEGKIFEFSNNEKSKFDLRASETAYINDITKKLFTLTKLNEAEKKVCIYPNEQEYKDFADRVLKLQQELLETPETSEVLTYITQLLGYANISELMKHYPELDNKVDGHAGLKISFENDFLYGISIFTLRSLLNRKNTNIRKIKVTKLRRLVSKELKRIIHDQNRTAM